MNEVEYKVIKNIQYFKLLIVKSLCFTFAPNLMLILE